MKRKHLKISILFVVPLLILSLLTAAVSAAGAKLSPALDTIAQSNIMIKSGLVGSAVNFDKEDFLIHSGIASAAVQITSLPPSSDGELMLGSTVVSTGQTISWNNLSLLRFVPATDVTETSFKFTSDGNYTTECSVKLSDNVGTAPTAGGGGITTVTQTDISCQGILTGDDPDGDLLYFELVSYPANGLVSLTDRVKGSFVYTPYEGFDGTDSFTYRVRDKMGHYSDICEVSLKVEKRSMTDVMADMDGHYAHSAAISAVSDGYMDAISENGRLYFDPDEKMTREEFLVTAMRALGAGELSPAKTVFADHDEINEKYSGFVAAAYKLGIIKGSPVDEDVFFRPRENITLAEAAVILNTVLGVSPIDGIDVSDAPEWARDDVSALRNIGLISSNDDCSMTESITKAQAAYILYGAKNIFS